MFEEDFERCFICQQQCKGLYCSSECRMQDKGTTSPALHAAPAPIRLTSHLPPSLSPHIRPVHHITPSPKMPAHLPADSSSSSSITSSPIQSPRTNASASDSPQKEIFNLPPPAFPAHHQNFAIPSSVPVKIPILMANHVSPAFLPVAHTPQSHGSNVQLIGASVDTLRFGRKPGVTNSVTSPNALLPRCACGQPANHRGRPSSKERAAMGNALTPLNIGPSVTERPRQRHVSGGAIPTSPPRVISGQHTPLSDIQTISGVIGGSLLLSRSRSDPTPPSPQGRTPIAPQVTQAPLISKISPTRRASHNDHDLPPAGPIGSIPASLSKGGLIPPESRRRGRSTERHRSHCNTSATGLFNQPTEREAAPSRSRHRREEARKQTEEIAKVQAQVQAALVVEKDPSSPVNAASITPSWSRRTSQTDVRSGGEGVAPANLRNPANGQRSPRSPAEGVSPSPEIQDARKVAELKRANNQLGQLFGIA